MEEYEASFEIDNDQVVVAWSEQAEALLGVHAHAAIGRPCYELMRGYRPCGARVCMPDCYAVQRLRAGEDVRLGEVYVRNGDLERVRCGVEARPLDLYAALAEVAR